MTTVTLYPTVSTHMAFKTSSSNINATPPGLVPFRTKNELSAGDYSNVQTDDTLYCTSSATVSSTGRYAWAGQRFSFDCTNYLNELSNINIKWAGYGTNIGDAAAFIDLYYLSGSPNTWQSLGTLPTSHSVPSWDFNYNDVTHYLSGSNMYNIAAVGQVVKIADNSNVIIFTTAAQITLTYTAAAAAKKTKVFNDGLVWIK